MERFDIFCKQEHDEIIQYLGHMYEIANNEKRYDDAYFLAESVVHINFLYECILEERNKDK